MLNIEIILGVLIFLGGLVLRLDYWAHKIGDPHLANLGGDPCHHYNIAHNVAQGLGPKTSFIFAYWFHHPQIPALTDVYPPGFHLVVGAVLRLFSDTFFVARVSSLVFGQLAIILMFFIGKKMHSRLAGLLAASVLAFSPAAVESSALVMTPAFVTLILALAIGSLLFSIERKKGWIMTGAISGWAMLSQGGTQFLALGLFAFLVIEVRAGKLNWRAAISSFGKYILGVLPILLPWGWVTWRYFGKPFYTNFSFYPLISDWTLMTYSRETPTWTDLFKSHSVGSLIAQYFVWGIVATRQLCQQAAPMFLGELSWLLIVPTAVWGVFRCRARAVVVWVSFICMFVVLVIASSGLGGRLYDRHFVPLLVFVAPLCGAGFADIVKRINFRTSLQRVFAALVGGAVLASWGVAAFHSLRSQESFWSLTRPSFFSIGEWIRENTPTSAVIMYAFTPQDLWCASGRRIVSDPSYAAPAALGARRAKEEVEYYGVNYLLVDLHNGVYGATWIHPEDIATHYRGINLHPVLTDVAAGYYLFAINQGVGK